MMNSLPRCSTAVFTRVEMVAGVELLGGAMVEVEEAVEAVMVELVVLATICLTTSCTIY